MLTLVASKKSQSVARKPVFRRAIELMSPYVPGEQPRPGQRLVKLNTNENPYPHSPRVRKAMIDSLSNARLRLYPAPGADEFVAAASQVYGVPANMILAGNGSDELLSMLFRAALGYRDKVAYPVPTYSLYDTLAEIQEAKVTRVRFSRDFRLPAPELIRAAANLTIVCNPNSPSGTFTPVAELDSLARKLVPRLLAIDEAYVDFGSDHAMRLLKRHRNVLILRTLSKSYSLAGMRLGLCFAHPSVINQLMKVKDSYNLSRPAIAAGVAALNDPASMKRNVDRVRRTRAEAVRFLRAFGFEVPDSAANFVLARLPGQDLSALAAAIREHGVLVRYFPTPELRDALRISIGTPGEMKELFAAMRNIVKVQSKLR